MKTPPHLKSDLLTGAAHGFFGREGGVSTGVFASLNAGPGSDDTPENVAENRARCAAAIGAEPARLITLYQIHSATIVEAEAPWPAVNGAPAPPKADGVVTNTPGLAIGVLTADCMPYLFIDRQAGVIGAAHAGWRGALAGVLENTIEKMTALGAAPGKIRAALGPCLRKENFEVGLDLVDAFCKKYPEAEQFMAPGATAEKRQFDLAAFGRWRLAAAGVDKVDDMARCTLGEEDRYFSYRGSRRAQVPDYGRNLSVIMLPETAC